MILHLNNVIITLQYLRRTNKNMVELQMSIILNIIQLHMRHTL